MKTLQEQKEQVEFYIKYYEDLIATYTLQAADYSAAIKEVESKLQLWVSKLKRLDKSLKI